MQIALSIRHRLFSSLRAAFPAFLLFFAASPAPAAPFTLPENAAIEVKTFTFPAAPAANATERDLPGSFHNQIIFSLQRAGFTILHSESEAWTATPAPQPDAAMSPAPAPAPLEITPLQESGPEHAAPEEAAEAEQQAEAKEPAAEPAETRPRDRKQQAEIPPFPVMPPEKRKPDYLLTGRVTLLKENVGAPTRIAGGIRIRTEASIHCAYQIVDASTGKVIISDVTSGSIASVASETHDIDAALAKLTDKVMAASAARIASRLSGVTVEAGDGGDDRDEYQDSPGKRLKPKK